MTVRMNAREHAAHVQRAEVALATRRILLPATMPAMPSKGQVQAARDAAERKQRALVSIRLAVEQALEAGLSAEDAAKAFGAVLRARGLLGTAGEIVKTARRARKK